MPSADRRSARRVQRCEWTNRRDALQRFARFSGRTQSQRHIKPLHWYVASRLVIEGGFRPDEIQPRPPFILKKKGGRYRLLFDPKAATGKEATLLGGLKTKDVDVVVSKEGIGPVLAVSCRGMTGALRNLVNRMEETIGECTNLHMTYPALVLGHLFVIRAYEASRSGVPPPGIAMNDIVISGLDEPVEPIQRFHSALCELSGRRGIRDELSRYESVALALVSVHGSDAGKVHAKFPPSASRLRIEKFFQRLYLRYDERFVVSAPRLNWITRRLQWSPDSPALADAAAPALDYDVRLDA